MPIVSGNAIMTIIIYNFTYCLQQIILLYACKKTQDIVLCFYIYFIILLPKIAVFALAVGWLVAV